MAPKRRICAVNPTPLEDNSLSEAQVRFYRGNGFLSLDGVARADEFAQILRVGDALFRQRAGAQEGAFFDFIGDVPMAEGALTQLINPSTYAPALKALDYRRRLTVIARQLLGPRARVSGDHIFFKPAVTGPATPWHQDEAFRDPRFDYHELSIWLPLQPVDEANGCLRFVPGSHLRGVLPHRKPAGKARVHGLECYDGFAEADAVACPLPLGGCTVHDGRMLHGAGPNRSEVPRFAYVTAFDVPRTIAAVPRNFPWLAERSGREEIEERWRHGKGRLVFLYRRFKQFNYLDPYRAYHGVRRQLWKIRHRLGRSGSVGTPASGKE
jgi:hypothetical protein